MKNEHEIWNLDSQKSLWVGFMESVGNKLAKHKYNLFLVETGTTIITEGKAFLYTRNHMSSEEGRVCQ
jgi:hypothetical protein